MPDGSHNSGDDYDLGTLFLQLYFIIIIAVDVFATIYDRNDDEN